MADTHAGEVVEEHNGKRYTAKRLARLRRIETLYLNHLCAKEIHVALLDTAHQVDYGTVRNDIVEVRRWWREAVERGDAKQASGRYLAAVSETRRLAFQGVTVEDKNGNKRVVGRDLRFTHEMDKEIARMHGVELKSDTKNFNLTVEAARNYMEKIMAIVFNRVEDRQVQLAIIADIELLADDDD